MTGTTAGITEVAVLVLKAPNGGVVALPDEVLNSFSVPGGEVALAQLAVALRPNTWTFLGEVLGQYTGPLAPLGSAPAGFQKPAGPGITGAHIRL